MKDYWVEAELEIISKTGMEFFFFQLSEQNPNVTPHIHAAVELLFVQSGKLHIFADEDELFANVGDVVLFRSNTIHRLYALEDGNASYYVLKFSPRLIMELSSPEHRSTYLLQLALNTKHEKTVWGSAEAEANGLHTALETLIRANGNSVLCGDIAMKIGTASVLLALLRDLLPDNPSGHALPDGNTARRIYDVTVYINEHYAEDLNAADCAARIFMSYSYFSRCFLRITGKSFKEYLNITRVNHAEKALLSTNRSVTEIASDCGFNNVSYFITVYKKIKGETPYSTRKHKGNPQE